MWSKKKFKAEMSENCVNALHGFPCALFFLLYSSGVIFFAAFLKDDHSLFIGCIVWDYFPYEVSQNLAKKLVVLKKI